MDFLNYWDGSWKIAKSLRYWDGAKWSKKHAFRRWAGAAWYPIETRQPAVLTGDSFTTQALWHFDEGTGNSIEDASPNNIALNRALYAEAPTWNTGYYYGALYFNDDRLRASHVTAFKFVNSDKFQIDVIFKFTGSAPAVNRVFCGYRYGGTGWLWVGTESSTGKLHFSLGDTNGGNDSETGTTNVYDAAWYKATFIWNNRILQVYLNGNLEGSHTSSLTGNFNTGEYLDIGWYYIDVEAYDYYALDQCYLDEIRILKGNICAWGGI